MVRRILLVEDDRNVRPVMEHVMVDGGYQVSVAGTVQEGLDLLRSRPFDLVIADVNLPDGNGLDVADAARDRGVRTLVVTAYGLSLRAGTLANYDYLLKPIRPRELLDAISQRLPAE